MISQSILPAASLNALAKMVSNSGFQRVIFGDDFKQYGRQMKTLLHKSGAELQEKCSLRDIIERSFNHLLSNYRHEYIYKTALLNNYILKYYSLADTVLLNEFKIGNSKADAVLVNGTNKVFEIKTELDSPDRLSTQLSDYYRAFSEVYIVIHNSNINKYVQLVNENIGIMTFDNNAIEVKRTAQSDQSRLDITAMIKALRKEEYLQVVKRLSGSIPDVQPVLMFKSCLNIFRQHSAANIQFEFLKVIKQRINPSINQFIYEGDLPDSLRLSCYHSNMNQNDYLSLIKRLSISF